MKSLSRKDRLVLKWSYKYIKPYIGKIVLMLISMILVAILVALEPSIRAKLINNMFLAEYSSSINIILLILIIYILQIIFNNIRYKLVTDIDVDICNDVKKETFSQIMELPIEAFDKIETGEFLSRMNGDIEELSNLFVNYSISVIDSALVIIFIGISMIKLNIFLFLIVVITFPITYKLFEVFGKKIRKQGQVYKNLNDKCYGKVQQCFAGVREIISLGMKGKIKNHINGILDNSNEQARRLQYINIKSNALVQGINNLDSIIFMIVAIFLISKGVLDVEEFITFLSYSIIFSNSLVDLTRINTIIQKVLVSLDRLYDLNNTFNYNPIKFGNISKQKLEGNIIFDNLTFGYISNHNIINKIDLNITQTGKFVIVGESGAGKSTLFNLLLRLYDNYQGEIFIDNVNIRELDELTIRNNISVVMQEPYLFSLSIKDNITLGNSEIGLTEIQRVCKMCNIHDFIIKLPKGYETLINEGGIGLSVGQKQRIAIARAILKKSSILLFDEITSALDNESQDAVNKLIDLISKDHTVIIITHRLNGVENADKIIVMDSGKIVGIGTHENLIKDSKRYIELFSKENEI